MTKKSIISLVILVLLLFAIFIYPKLPNRTEAKDNNRNEKIETWITYRLWQQKTAEVDGNEDGRVDFWQYRNNFGVLEKEELDNNFDAKPDFWVYYNPKYIPIRIERDEDFNGTKDKPKENEVLDDSAFAPLYERQESYWNLFTYYFANGKLAKVESKTSDKKTVDSIDYYNDKGEIAKTEMLIDGQMKIVPQEK